jgi:predicted Zn-dependent protease
MVLAVIPLAFGGLLLQMMLMKRRKTLLADVLNAFQVHDFRGALKLCLDSPKVVRRSHLLRYNQALAQAACGDVRGAIETLESLWVDRPSYLVTGFMLCGLFLKSDQPERVIGLARRLAEQLPGDPQPPYYLALASRRLNRIEEAELACNETLRFKPQSGPAHALLAGLALDRNDIDRAAELFEKAWELAPGDSYLRIVEAEISLSRDPVDVARQAVLRAVEANKSDWLCVMDYELRRLEERLKDRESPVATEDIFLA